MWRIVFSRLLNILIEKAEAPLEDSLSRADAELLRCYRQDIADTVVRKFHCLNMSIIIHFLLSIAGDIFTLYFLV